MAQKKEKRKLSSDVCVVSVEPGWNDGNESLARDGQNEWKAEQWGCSFED